jgi:hypothetical protein
MFVDSLKVHQVETPFQRCPRQLVRTCRHQSGFDLFKGALVGYAETVY